MPFQDRIAKIHASKSRPYMPMRARLPVNIALSIHNSLTRGVD